jgi:hypothetical protein
MKDKVVFVSVLDSGTHEDRQDHWQNVIGVQMNSLLGRYLARPMEVFELEEVSL